MSTRAAQLRGLIRNEEQRTRERDAAIESSLDGTAPHLRPAGGRLLAYRRQLADLTLSAAPQTTEEPLAGSLVPSSAQPDPIS